MKNYILKIYFRVSIRFCFSMICKHDFMLLYDKFVRFFNKSIQLILQNRSFTVSERIRTKYCVSNTHKKNIYKDILYSSPFKTTLWNLPNILEKFQNSGKKITRHGCIFCMFLDELFFMREMHDLSWMHLIYVEFRFKNNFHFMKDI